MRKILQFLANDGDYLYRELGYRITDSTYHDSFGGTGSITLSDGRLAIKLWLDRDRLFVDFGSARRGKRTSWYSLGIVKELLTGKFGDESLRRADNRKFFRTHLTRISDLFSASKLAETTLKCKELERSRSTRLFD